MELINREDHQKLYLQLYDILKKKIESGEWSLNSQIPTEEDLCSNVQRQQGNGEDSGPQTRQARLS